MDSCIFCGIVDGKISSTKVWESDSVLAFRDIDPKAPVHVLIVPKKHIASNNDITVDDAPLAGSLLVAAREIAQKEGVFEDGYRLVFNCGTNGGQAVGHLHLHLLGGRQMDWPPG